MIRIFVNGKPEPGGSKSAIPHWGLVNRFARSMNGAKWIRADQIMQVIRVKDANDKVGKWKELVQAAALSQTPPDHKPYSEPLVMCAVFFRKRPASHFTKKGTLSAIGRRNPEPITKPDALKYLRPVEDALTKIVYDDDSRVTASFLFKQYVDNDEDQGAYITVMPKSKWSYCLEFVPRNDEDA